MSFYQYLLVGCVVLLFTLPREGLATQTGVHGPWCTGPCTKQTGGFYQCPIHDGASTDDCSPEPWTDRWGQKCTSECAWAYGPGNDYGGYYWCYSGDSWWGCSKFF